MADVEAKMGKGKDMVNVAAVGRVCEAAIEKAEDMANTVAIGTGTANAENKEAAVVTVVLDRDSWADTEMPCVANTKKQTRRERPANFVKYN